MTGEQLRREYLEIRSKLVSVYQERARLPYANLAKGTEGTEKCGSKGIRGLEEANEQISLAKDKLAKLCEAARAVGKPLKLEAVAQECELSEIEKEILIVLLMKDAGPGCSGGQTYPTGSELLRLFYRHDFEILEARRLLYPDAPLRRNNLITVEDYAESVLNCTFRVPEQMIRRLLEHDA
jgi:hypothetical protein